MVDRPDASCLAPSLANDIAQKLLDDAQAPSIALYNARERISACAPVLARNEALKDPADSAETIEMRTALYQATAYGQLSEDVTKSVVKKLQDAGDKLPPNFETTIQRRLSNQ